MSRNRVSTWCLAAAATLSVTSGVLIVTSADKLVMVNMIVRDIPQKGVILIPPADSTFERHFDAIFKANSSLAGNPSLVNTMKPYSVVLNNNGQKRIVGYSLKWQIVSPNDTGTTHWVCGVNPSSLLRGAEVPGDPSFQAWLSNADYAISPGSSKLISLLFSVGPSGLGSMGALAWSTADSATARNGTFPDGRSPMARVAEMLAAAKSITITVDGVFFEDGTFTGPNTSQVFERVKATIDATRDLQEEVALRVKRGQLAEDIFTNIEGLAKEPDVTPPDNGGQYEQAKGAYARSLIQSRQIIGADRAISNVLNELGRDKRLPLRKEADQ